MLAIHAFEFLPQFETEQQRAALRTVTKALKRRFRLLDQALVVVHSYHFGEPPKIGSGARRVKAYRRALEGVMQMTRELRLGACLKPKPPTDDILIGRDRALDMRHELIELTQRTGLHRML